MESPENEDNTPLHEGEKNSAQKNDLKKAGGPEKKTGWESMLPPVGTGQFWNNLVIVVVVLLALTAAYSYSVSHAVKQEELSISNVAESVKKGEVKTIIVRGDTLEINYTDETKTKGTARKERDAAITDSLSKLGVTGEQISKVSIDVQDETGFRFWLVTLAPFIFPAVLIGFFAWFFLRQVRERGCRR